MKRKKNQARVKSHCNVRVPLRCERRWKKNQPCDMRSRALRPLPGALARAGHVTTGRERSGSRLTVCAGRSCAQTAHRELQWQPTWPQPATSKPAARHRPTS
eukprot:3629058-Prymnesium_polylepis.1